MTCEDCKYFESCFEHIFEYDEEYQIMISYLCVKFTVKGGDTFDRD